MIISKKFLIIILFSLSFNLYSSTLVKLKDGHNYIDLNGNGTKDIVFFASFDNNTSHPNHTATFFMRKNNRWSIILVPDDDGFVWSDFSLSASMTKIVDFELHQYKNTYFMIKGIKFSELYNRSDLTDYTKIKFTRYKIVSNHTDPGVPELYWQPTGSYLTNEKYLNVDEAFKLLDMSKFK
ncbi:carbapenem self-resistance protein CarG family protein [Providencia burhodogranariea]|uniref:CpmJ protein n=1 Tax=Providencia burhodogranariea DSM 19968 TaxID=1141662 RepID=K8WQN1_9GAMM|nr:hypothetical protein OOA_05561 [Providencia burhodogranariea DSM 19968]